MATCTQCGVARDDLPEGRVCRDCLAGLQPTQKARDFVAWLREKHPEVVERAMLSEAGDNEKVQ